MGPLVYTSGNPDDEANDSPSVSPSMGPLVYTSGNAENAVLDLRGSVALQWGRWFTPAETQGQPPLPGNRPLTFNGAAGLHQRKQSRRLPVRSSFAPPSMGPLVYTSGNRDWLSGKPPGKNCLQWGRWFTPAETIACACWPTCRASAFNGAAGLHQRKLGRPAAEGLMQRLPSMGPLVYTSGNLPGVPQPPNG